MEDVAGRCGILSVEDWMLAPDGRQYRYFWCERWVQVKDGSMCAMLPSTTDVAAIVISEENARGWCRCVDPPASSECYVVKTGK